MRFILLCIVLMLSWGCDRSEAPEPSSQPKTVIKPGEVRLAELEKRDDGRYYFKGGGASEPFTGVTVERHANGQVQHEVRLVAGLKPRLE